MHVAQELAIESWMPEDIRVAADGYLASQGIVEKSRAA